MKKLFVSEDWFSIMQVTQLLDANRIPFLVKNEFASGAVGEIPPLDALPEVWLLEDDWYARANALIDDLRHLPTEGDSWICASCEEENDGNFKLCWQCGAVKCEREKEVENS
jgi:hypothetical protein